MYYDQIKLLKQGVEKARGLLGDAIDVVPGLGTVNQGLLAAENIGRGNLAGAAENIQNLVPTGKIAGRAIKALTKGKGQSELSGLLSAKAPRQDALDLAQKRAALPVSEGGLGLPPDNTPMDRAKAMGFDVDSPLYHGSPEDFTAFNKDMVKSRFNQSFGFHFANTPSEAKLYAGTYNEPRRYLVQRGNEMRIDIPEGGPYTTASMKADYDRAEIINNLLSAKNAGKPFDSVRISKTAAPDWQDWGAVNENTVMFDPAKIRLAGAAFDPFRRNEADLLALQGGQHTPQDLLGFERMLGLLGE